MLLYWNICAKQNFITVKTLQVAHSPVLQSCETYLTITVRIIKSALPTEIAGVETYITKIATNEKEIEKVVNLMSQHNSDVQRRQLDHMVEIFEKPMTRISEQLSDICDEWSRKFLK